MDKQKQRGWVLIVSGAIIFFFNLIYTVATGEYDNQKFYPPAYISAIVFGVGYFLVVDSQRTTKTYEKENLITGMIFAMYLPLIVFSIIGHMTGHGIYLHCFLSIVVCAVLLIFTSLFRYEDHPYLGRGGP